MKKLLFFLCSILPILGSAQVSQATKLIAGSNITLNQAGNTYTVSVSGAMTSSQWVTATSPTTAITYTVGNVGIGTTTVSAALDVATTGTVVPIEATTVQGTVFQVDALGRCGMGKTAPREYQFCGIRSGANIDTSSSGIDGVFCFGYEAGRDITTGRNLTIFGGSAGQKITTGMATVLVGQHAGNNLTTQISNTMVGNQAGQNATSSYNSLFGNYAGQLLTSGQENCIGGSNAGQKMTNADNTAAWGTYAFYNTTTGDANTGIGEEVGFSNVTGSRNVFLGAYAGYYETASDKLFIDNRLRSNETRARNQSLIYGVFNADSSAQTLTVNGQFSGGASKKVTITADGRLYGTALHNNAGSVSGPTDQFVASGTYTATLTNTTNIDASTAFQAQWMRVGNVVTVSGKVQVDITTGSASTVLGMSLPLTSNIGAEENLGGVMHDGSQTTTAKVVGDSANDRAKFEWSGQTDTSLTSYAFTFTYLIQ